MIENLQEAYLNDAANMESQISAAHYRYTNAEAMEINHTEKLLLGRLISVGREYAVILNQLAEANKS